MKHFAFFAAIGAASIVAAAVGCDSATCLICLGGGGAASTTTTTTTTTSETGGAGGSGGGTATSTTFLCKGLMCKRGSEVCTVMTSQGNVGQCTSLPLPCLAPSADCTCFTLMAGCTCEQQESGDFAIFCE